MQGQCPDVASQKQQRVNFSIASEALEEADLDELMDSGPMHPDDDGRDLRPKKKDEDK